MKPGTELGHYEIVSELGKGGMGEVYRARDTKLGREVAIKVLPAEFSRDAERLARMEREARMLAALNHPNIAAIYGLEQSDDTRFLVLELVEGDTLADKLKRGPIPVEDGLKLALQIAEALEAAHEKGVIHRDLKPANIKITPAGRVKVLDFGLAKAFIGEQSDVNLSNSPTLSMAATQQGLVLGTAGYMSPEQANGEIADRRADIWSFGVVLFEMLTGRPLFTGKTVSYILADVLRTEPEWTALPANLHPRVRLLLERCLEKEAKDRLSGISDARVELQRVLADPEGVLLRPQVVATGTAPHSKGRLALGLAATAAIAVIGTWFLKPAPLPEPGPVVRWEYVLPDGTSFRNMGSPAVAVSPDGSRFVYNAVGGLYLRSIGESEARLIPGTEQGLNNVTFSPDGEWLAFWSFGDGQVKKIPVVGGAAVTLVSGVVSPIGISWDREDTIVFTGADGVKRVSADGGEPEILIPPDRAGFGAFAQLLRGVEALLVTTIDGNIAVYDIASGEAHTLLPGGRPRYVPTGHIVYAQGNVLFAVPFDLDTLEVTGGPVPMVEGVQSGPAQYSISDNGWLVYVPDVASAMPEGILAFADDDGTRDPLNLPPDQYRSPRVSPDGSQVAVEIIEDDDSSDIWVYDLAGTSAIRRLTNQGSNTRPVWTPDGKRLTYASDREGTWGIYWQAADGSDVAERLTTAEGAAQHYPESWSPDMSTLAYVVAAGQWDLWMLSMDTGTSEPFVATPGSNDFGAAFSPDGHWIAYSKTETQPFRIQVQPFPPTGIEYDVLQEGETWPVWSPDGGRLFSRLNLATQQSIEIRGINISTGGNFSFGNPSALPLRGALLFPLYRDYDIAPDGRFLTIFSPDTRGTAAEAPRPRVMVVQNWFQELRERVPVD